MTPLLNLLIFFGLALLAALVWTVRRLRGGRARSRRALLEDALKHAWNREQEGLGATIVGIAGTLGIGEEAAVALVERLQYAGLVTLRATRIHLTDTGRKHALQIVRAHRLWESYLADKTGVGPERWHIEAERIEHALSRDEIEKLAERLGNPVYDPHGDPIPTATGELPSSDWQALSDLAPGIAARIAHIEDEPDIVYAQLLAEGLYPDMELVVEARSEQRIICSGEGRQFVLAPIVARNVSVVPAPVETVPSSRPTATLAEIGPGQAAEVVFIGGACHGLERRRLMDLGIVRGTRIAFDRRGLWGGVNAYRVKGATIALRTEQAAAVRVHLLGDPGR